jgi:hypothetical protein
MKLDFLAAGSLDCPLLRLYEFTPGEADQLRGALKRLASGEVAEVLVHALQGVEAIGGCRLALRLGQQDQAVRRTGPASFACAFTAGTWDNIAGLVEPFAHGSSGFHWLAGVPGEAALLLSASGEW